MVVTTTWAVSRLPDGGRFLALDSWRGIAALLIVFFHMQTTGLAPFTPLLANGWFAVDFFFVLSGFVISAAYGERLAHGFSIGRYMLLRLGRLYPLHLAVLAAYLALESVRLVVPVPWLIAQPPFSGTRTVGTLIQTLLLMQVFTTPTALGWSPASWSISAEIWLYVLAALAWRSLGEKAWLAAALASIAALFFSSFAGADGAFVNPEVLRGIAGFGIGMLCWKAWSAGLGAFWRRLPTFAAFALELIAAISAIAAVILGLPLAAVDPAFAFLVLAFAADRGAGAKLLATPPFVWIGVLSYSIYLVHLLVLRLVEGLLHLVAADLVPAPWGIAATAMVPPTFAVAYLTWRFVEAPARNWSRRRAADFGAGAEERVAPAI